MQTKVAEVTVELQFSVKRLMPDLFEVTNMCTEDLGLSERKSQQCRAAWYQVNTAGGVTDYSDPVSYGQEIQTLKQHY